MEEEDNIIVKWAQEDVETSYSLLNKYNSSVKNALIFCPEITPSNVPFYMEIR